MIEPPKPPERASASIARNALVRTAGELLAKAASVVFFVLIARELGEAAFGDFSFALALTSTLLLAAGLGTEELTTREISRDRSTVHVYMTNVVIIKVILSALLIVVAVGIVALGSYPGGCEGRGCPRGRRGGVREHRPLVLVGVPGVRASGAAGRLADRPALRHARRSPWWRSQPAAASSRSRAPSLRVRCSTW